jgi:dihydrolipoamide dehydrogenase
MNQKKLILLVLLAIAIAVFFVLDLNQYLSLDFFKSQQHAIGDHFQHYPLQTAAIFFAVYVVVTGLSLPGAALMTLVAGAIFGLGWGVLIVSFASTLGATFAFWVSRFLLRDTVQKKFSSGLKTINDGIEKDGAFYLFTLRLVPVFPFFMINLLMGLTPIKTATFFVVSQLGMLAGTIVYVNAGTQIAQLDSLSGILSPALLGSFALLGLFPLVAKKLIDYLKVRRAHGRWEKPKFFDNNLVVIGAGAGGLVSAYIAAAVKAKVTLIEKHEMGGDCLNTGCVPSKALIRSAKFMSQVKRAKDFGITEASARTNFSDVMGRVKNVIKSIEPHDSVERYTGLGVNVIKGEAKITSPYTVEVNGQTITTKNIVIATGGRPFVPPIKGLQETGYLTSDSVWNLNELPKRLVVMGGGPIGCELTQSFARLGSDVVQIEMLSRLMIREDEDVSDIVKQRLISEGVEVRTNTKAIEVVIEDGEKYLLCTTNTSEYSGKTIRFAFDEILVAVGRKANTSGFGLDTLNIPLNANGTISVNEYLQTNYPNVYAVGDVAGPFQFTHTASHQAWYAAVNSLFGVIRKFKADYSVIPWATFVEPEVARVGINEQDAIAANVPYEVTRYGIDDLDRAIADSEAHGFVKVLTVPGKDRILGVTIVGEHAGDLISEYVLAMRHGLGLNKVLSTIHIYPTFSEANKYVAGEWKKAHTPEALLRWVAAWHRWRRGSETDICRESKTV